MEEEERQRYDRSFSSSVLWNRLVLSILITETAERVAYFGFRAVLVLYFTRGLQFSESTAVSLCASTIALAYLSPLVGAILADSIWGRFQTIWRFGCFYALGLILLTWASMGVPNYQDEGEGEGEGGEDQEPVPENLRTKRLLTFVSLFLVCMGTGGIKPCVSAFGADQVVMDDDVSGKEPLKGTQDSVSEKEVDSRRQERISEFFSSFYFAVNLGALGSFAVIPVVRAKFGFAASFLIPTISMILALLVFRYHKQSYKHRTRDESQHSLLEVFQVSFSILRDRFFDTRLVRWICPRRSVWIERVPINYIEHESDMAEDPPNTSVYRDAAQALHLLPLMAFFPVFWMLYDQQGSVWTLQASRMNLHGLEPEQLQFLNPLQIMLFIPLFDMKIYPWMEGLGISVAPVRKMEYGMFLAAVSFAISALLERSIRTQDAMSVSVLWQVPQITVLTVAEIFLNVTGLKFAYSQAPPNMQAFIVSLYLFMTAIGDGLGALLYGSIFAYLSMTTTMIICAVCMLLNMFCFSMVAKSWKPFDHGGAAIHGLELGSLHNMQHQN